MADHIFIKLSREDAKRWADAPGGDALFDLRFNTAEACREALAKESDAVQIHIDTRSAEDDAFARGRRVGYEEGRRSR